MSDIFIRRREDPAIYIQRRGHVGRVWSEATASQETKDHWEPSAVRKG